MNNYTETKKTKKFLFSLLINSIGMAIIMPPFFSITTNVRNTFFPPKPIPNLPTAAPIYKARVNYQFNKNNDVFKIKKLKSSFNGMLNSYDVTRINPYVTKARQNWIDRNPPEKVTNKQTHEVVIANKKYFITTFTYKKINYWSMLGNTVRYKDGNEIAERLKKWVNNNAKYKNYKPLPFTIIFDHVYPQPFREAMGINENYAHTVMIPNFLNFARTNNTYKDNGILLDKYTGFDFTLDTDTNEPELGFHKISATRQSDVLARLLPLINPTVSPFVSNPLIPADKLQILFDLWDEFEKGYESAYTKDNTLYENEFCQKYSIDPNKPESMMAFYLEMLLNAQDKDFMEIKNYFTQMQTETGNLLSEEYLIESILKGTKLQSTYIHELTQFIDSPRYCTYVKTKLEEANY